MRGPSPVHAAAIAATEEKAAQPPPLHSIRGSASKSRQKAKWAVSVLSPLQPPCFAVTYAPILGIRMRSPDVGLNEL